MQVDDDLQDPSRGPKPFQKVEQDTQSLAQRLSELMRALATERLRAEGLQKATKVSLTPLKGIHAYHWVCLVLWQSVSTSGLRGSHAAPSGNDCCSPAALHFGLLCTGLGRYCGPFGLQNASKFTHVSALRSQ